MGCQPASPAREDRLTRLLRLTAHEAGVPASGGRRGLRNRYFPFAAYHPRWVPGTLCVGQMVAPHHLSGPPLPATAVPEIGATVEPKVSIPAANSTIASNVFMFSTPGALMLVVRTSGRETALHFGGTATCTAPMRRWLKRSG